MYVAKKDENHVGVINGAGRTVVPFDYQAIGDFDGTSGLAKAIDREGKPLYINRSGRVAIKNEIYWEKVGNFSGDMLLCNRKKSEWCCCNYLYHWKVADLINLSLIFC